MSMLYSLLRPLLFRLDPEQAHEVSLNGLRVCNNYGLDTLFGSRPAPLPIEVMGMTFPNPVGIGAGLDKNGEYIDALAGLGFGFIEVGTVTPKPQAGNDKPRLFRFPGADAIINRMGFNNHGVDALLENLKKTRYRGILGINIGKNATTPIESAVDDYLICMNKVYPYASYITINISSPNTKGLRDLQNEAALSVLLSQLKMRQLELADQTGRYVPLVVKIAPDWTTEAIAGIAKLLIEHRIDGVIATNTTLSRDGLMHLPGAEQQGGMSGAPLNSKSTLVIRELALQLEGAVPIIGVGGITRGGDAWEKIDAGASLVQIYSGLIFRGPVLVNECVEAARPFLAELEAKRQKQRAMWQQARAEAEAAKAAAEAQAANAATTDSQPPATA